MGMGLIALLGRLSQCEVASTPAAYLDDDVANDVTDGRGVTSGVAAPRDVDDIAMADAGDDDDRSAMGDENEDDDMATKLRHGPFDIDALAAELDRVPGLRFQEQVSFCSTRGREGGGIGRRDGKDVIVQFESHCYCLSSAAQCHCAAARRAVPHIKSTSRLYSACLANLRTQFSDREPTLVLSRGQLFDLLSSVQLASSFYSSMMRRSAVERRLQALSCLVYAHPDQGAVGAYFTAQPELCGSWRICSGTW